MIEHSLFFIALLFLSYVIGSIPTSIIMGKLVKGIDIREHGSGNAGGTNVFRVLGWKPALVVLIVDAGKGWLPPAVLAIYFIDYMPISDLGFIQIACGFASILGHTYTIFAKFKGGKGVGTLGGMLIALFPFATPLCLMVFIITLMTTGYVSVGSMLASASLPFFLFILPAVTSISPPSLSLMIFSLLVPWFIVFTHRSNIGRLRDGTENRFEKAMIFHRKAG